MTDGKDAARSGKQWVGPTENGETRCTNALLAAWQRISRGPRIGAVLLATAAAILATWPTWHLLHRLWLDTAAYAHGPLIVLITLVWLFDQARRNVSDFERGPRSAFLLLTGAVAAWLVVYKANSALGQEVLAPWIIWLSIASMNGFATALRLATPVLYLYFAIPVWDVLIAPLQRLTIAASEIALAWMNIPAVIQGDLVTIPEGSFRIAESCSGKAYLVVALALACLFVKLHPMRRLRAGAFIALACALALVANWIRVITVIYAGHSTNMRHYLVAREHGSFGWFIDFMLLGVIYWIGTRLARAGHASSGAETRSSQSADQSAEMNSRPSVESVEPSMRVALVRALIVLMLPVAAVAYARAEIAHGPVRESALDLPSAASVTWQGSLAASSSWSPRFDGASSLALGTYHLSGRRVETFVAEYRTQRQGAELVGGNNRLTGEDWTTLSTSRFSDVRNPLARKARIIRAQEPGGRRWLISYVYYVDPVITSSGTLAQFTYGALSWLSEKSARAVVLATECTTASCNDAEDLISASWEMLGPKLIDESVNSHAP